MGYACNLMHVTYDHITEPPSLKSCNSLFSCGFNFHKIHPYKNYMLSSYLLSGISCFMSYLHADISYTEIISHLILQLFSFLLMSLFESWVVDSFHFSFSGEA